MDLSNNKKSKRGNIQHRYLASCLLFLVLFISIGTAALGQGMVTTIAGEKPSINAPKHALPAKKVAKQQERPNIIIFLSDDHGAEDAACYGSPDLATPVIDQLAREGMMFTRAFTPVPVCSPSRSALFSGLYPHRNGCHQNHGEINASIKTLPGYLAPLGYTVVLAGKRHIAPEEAFDFTYMDIEEVPLFLKNIGDDPFCLIIAFNHPHQPY